MIQDQSHNPAGASTLAPNRHHLPAMVITSLFLLLLAACSQSQQATPTQTLTPTLNAMLTSSPTATRIPRPSFTPRPTRQYVRPSHITPSATRRSSRPTPTVTVTATPLAIFNMVAGNADPANYQLTTPEPELIIHVIAEADEQKWDTRFGERPDETFRQALSNDAMAAFRAAIFELQYHYPQGLPNPRLAFSIQGNPYVWSDEYTWFMPILQAGIFDFLHNLELYDQQTINPGSMATQIFQAELDGDPGVEWLAFANSSRYSMLTWLRIDTLPDGTYQLMPLAADKFNFLTYGNDPVQVEGVGDFNGDGLTDMLLNTPLYLAGGYNYRFLFAQGSPAGFEVASEIEAHVFVTDGELEYTVTQPHEPEQLILTITDPFDLNWDCRYDTITTYEWSNGNLLTTQEGTEPPLTAECYLARAVTLRNPLNPDTNIPALQQALALFAEDDPEDIPKIAFAHYRLAVLYAMQQDDAQARAHLQAFLDFNLLASNGPFRSVNDEVTALLSAPRLDPLTLCGWIAGTPYNYFPDWSVYTNQTAAEHAYPLSNDISPRALCPVSQVVDWILESVIVVPGVSPSRALVSAGLPVVTTQALWLPGWQEPAWLVLLQLDPYYLVSYRPWNEDDPWKEEEYFSPNTGDASWLNQDVTGDGYPEIAFAVPLLDPSGAYTGSYQVSITSMVMEGVMVEVNAYTTVPAGEQFNLVRFLADHDGDGFADAAVAEAVLWYDAVPTLEPADPPIWPTFSEWSAMLQTSALAQHAQEAELEVLSAIFEGADPAETRAVLSQIRDDLQGTDPSTLLYRQRLMYLIGLSYELEGEAELAVATYLQVILDNPDSLWSSLAAGHLAPIEQP